MSLLPSLLVVQVAFAPLPPFVAKALAEVEVESSIDGPGMFRLHFDLSRNIIGDFDVLMFDIFRPLAPVRISLSSGLGLPRALINGYVRDVKLQVGDEPGSSRLEVVGSDALGSIMGHVQLPMPWPNLPDSQVVAAIFTKYALLPKVTPTPPTRTILDNITLQPMRDSAFLQQLASFHGYHLFVQPDPLIGVDVGHFEPVTVMMATPPQGVLSIDFGSQSNLRSFNVSNQMLKPTTVVSIFPEPSTRAPVPIVAAAALDLPLGIEPSLTRIVPPPVEIEAGNDAANVAEKVLRASAKVTRSARNIQASGEVDGLKFTRPLSPGAPVMVRGAGRQHSGPYLVTEVAHRISRDNYSQTFQALRNAVGLTGAELFVDPLAPVS